MMSKKSWFKLTPTIELIPQLIPAMIPLVATWTHLASAQVSAPPPAPVAMPSSQPSSVPSAAPSNSPTSSSGIASTAPVYAAAASDPISLNFEAAKKAIKGLEIVAIHEDSQDPNSPIKGAMLRGKIPNTCAEHLSISNTVADSSIVSDSNIGFKITFDGKDANCLNLKNFTCTPKTCMSISTLDGANMDLSGYSKNGKIGLVSDNLNSEGTAWEKLSDDNKFESAATIKSRRDREAQDLLQARIDANIQKFEKCRGNLDELAIATKALNALVRDTHMALEDQNEKRQELDKVRARLIVKEKLEQRKSLQKRIAKVKNLEEARELSEELDGFASENPEMANSIRELQQELIDHIRDNLDDSAESFATRKQIYQTMLGMDGVSAAEAKRYRVQMDGLDIAQQAMMFQSGNFTGMNFYSFWSNYQKLWQTSQKDYMSSCQNTKGNALSGACSDAMKNMAAVQQLPQVATNAISQQQQQQAAMYQMQQSMNRYMYQSMNTNSGMSFNAGATFGAPNNGFNTQAPQFQMNAPVGFNQAGGFNAGQPGTRF